MAKIQRKPLTLDDLYKRLDYIKHCMDNESDVMKRLDLIQARIDCNTAIKELILGKRERIR